MSDERNDRLPEEELEPEEEETGISRRKRKKRLMLFYISAFSAVVVCAVLLCVFVFFRVDTVTVIGGNSYRQEDILSICNIQEGDNLVLLATREREAELEHRFPYIEEVRIRRRLPSTVEVHIKEAVTSYSVESASGKYLYVSRAGKVLEFASMPYAGTAVIRGTTPTAKEPSEIIDFEEEEAALVFEAITAQLREKDVAGITDVDMTNRYDVTMTYDSRILFRFGNTNSMRYKMAFGLEMLDRLLEEGAITDETFAQIDLTMVPDKQKAVYKEVIPGEEETSRPQNSAAAGRVPSGG